jgi:hypothetical protein
VYRYVRIRWRCSNEDAKDLTQTFFAAAIEKNILHGYDASKGTFRTFSGKFASRQKRSGELVEVDAVAGVESPEDIFEREWTRSVFEDAVEELRASLEARGRASLARDGSPRRSIRCRSGFSPAWRWDAEKVVAGTARFAVVGQAVPPAIRAIQRLFSSPAC